jgi:acetyl-CoA acetyltransferase
MAARYTRSSAGRTLVPVQAEAVIAGAAETPYTRHPAAEVTTESLLADAFFRVLSCAGVERDAVDGLGVSSFTLAPDHAIDIAWKLGLRPRWIMDDANGGASGLNLLQHALRAVEAGDASTIVLVAGDHLPRDAFHSLVDRFNRVATELLAPLPVDGPNALFALLTQRHMAANGLDRSHYGRLAIAQRRFAAANPLAVYREPLTLEDYLAAPIVAEPLGLYDCVPVVSGADAILVTGRDRAPSGIRVRALRALHNADGQDGDGLTTGLATIAPSLWRDAGLGPGEVDAWGIYDDYPAMVFVQLADLGIVEQGGMREFAERRLGDGGFRLNTSGGMLSAGQAGAAGGLHHLVEAVLQLRGEAPGRQSSSGRIALVTGYGMTLYRFGACAIAAVLEAPPR